MKRSIVGHRHIDRPAVMAAARKPGAKPLRRGFTLMETLVALGLCGLIVASVGASLEVYWRFSTLSRERVSASQVQRGIVEDLTSDLRTAVPLAKPPMSPGELPATSPVAGPGAGGVGEEMFLNVAEQMLSLTTAERQPVHFFGSADALAILTEHSSPRFSGSGISGYRTIRQRHVVWWLNQGQTIRLPLYAVGRRVESTAVSAGDLAAGLVRTERSLTSSQNSESDMPPLLISADVTALRWRYFDGTQWLSEWDSLKRLAIPQAVEVQLTFRNQPTLTQRMVILLPQAGTAR